MAGLDTIAAGDTLARRLGERIRSRRKELGRTLADVAGEAAVSVSFLSAVEKGTNQPSLAVLVRVVHALGLSIADVLHSEGQNLALLDGIDLDAAGTRSLGHPKLRLAVVVQGSEPGGAGDAPVPLGERDLCVVVRRGTLDLEVDGARYELRPGDSLSARAPGTVSWSNPGDELAVSIWASGMPRASRGR